MFTLLLKLKELVEAVIFGIRGTPIGQQRLDDIVNRLNLFTAEAEDEEGEEDVELISDANQENSVFENV